MFGEPAPREPVYEGRVADYSRDIRLEVYEKSQKAFEAVGFELMAEGAGLA